MAKKRCDSGFTLIELIELIVVAIMLAFFCILVVPDNDLMEQLVSTEIETEKPPTPEKTESVECKDRANENDDQVYKNFADIPLPQYYKAYFYDVSGCGKGWLIVIPTDTGLIKPPYAVELHSNNAMAHLWNSRRVVATTLTYSRIDFATGQLPRGEVIAKHGSFWPKELIESKKFHTDPDFNWFVVDIKLESGKLERIIARKDLFDLLDIGDRLPYRKIIEPTLLDPETARKSGGWVFKPYAHNGNLAWFIPKNGDDPFPVVLNYSDWEKGEYPTSGELSRFYGRVLEPKILPDFGLIPEGKVVDIMVFEGNNFVTIEKDDKKCRYLVNEEILKKLKVGDDLPLPEKKRETKSF